MMYYKKCYICEKEFFNPKVFANHVKWKHSTEEKLLETKKKLKESAVKNNEKRFGKKVIVRRKCDKCGKEYETIAKFKDEIQIPFSNKKNEIKWYKSNFCSLGCAHYRYNLREAWTEEKKEKAKIRSKKLWLDEEYALKCIKSNKIFSSKKEREIVNYFRTNFPDDEWTFGPFGKKNEVRINCDLYSHKLKVVFEYDGDWHFKEINGQLENKRKKDRILEELVKEKGYRLIRIDEKENLSIDKIKELIYNKEEPIIKIGKRY